MVQLVTDYSKQFPLRVKVVRGLKEQITAKSILNIHFLKQTNVSTRTGPLKINQHIKYHCENKSITLKSPNTHTHTRCAMYTKIVLNKCAVYTFIIN